jgi:hypothetical protein
MLACAQKLQTSFSLQVFLYHIQPIRRKLQMLSWYNKMLHLLEYDK